MDITKFVVSQREEALLYGDYGTYCTRLSRRLASCRKNLNIATRNRGKYHPKAPVTAEQIAENPEYLRLALMTAERAWADAMKMKAAHAADAKGVSGRTRSQVITALTKAAKTADHLAAVLAEDASNAGQPDVLEALAYAALLNGATQFEKQTWEQSLRNYAVARVIYVVLSSSSRGDVFKDLLSETIDPSIRYAAYQLKTARSLPIPAIARKAFPYDDKELVARINKVDPAALQHSEQDEKKGLSGAEGASRNISWRSREVRIEDAAIATAWAALGVARSELEKKLSSSGQRSPKDTAAAYDEVLTASQDAVDATKQAIDELRGDGVAQSDPRMQSLYITRTAVNYEMISWRIGRNRVFTGERDGAILTATSELSRKASKRSSTADATKQDPPGRQIARLKEKVVLYDGTLQSLESVKELPGVAADEDLAGQLEATIQYFTSLKCLAIARSYSIAGNALNALALVQHGFTQSQRCLSSLSQQGKEASGLRNIEVSHEDADFLHQLLRGELERYRGLVEIEKLHKQSGGGKGGIIPLGERLGDYPPEPVDLSHIVTYPPRLEVIPVKPLFLDVAWNHIDYPDKTGKSTAKGKEKPEEKPQKRGWFWSSK